jgi:hypothetical protein
MLGRATAPGEAAPTAVVTTALASEPSVIGETLPAPDSSDAPPTTRFRPIVGAPSTAPPAAPEADVDVAPVLVPEVEPGEPVASIVDVDGHLVDLDVEIVMRGPGRQIYELDPSSSELIEREVGRQPFGPAAVVAGVDWVLLPSWDDPLPSLLIHDDAAVEAIDIGVA